MTDSGNDTDPMQRMIDSILDSDRMVRDVEKAIQQMIIGITAATTVEINQLIRNNTLPPKPTPAGPTIQDTVTDCLIKSIGKSCPGR